VRTERPQTRRARLSKTSVIREVIAVESGALAAHDEPMNFISPSRTVLALTFAVLLLAPGATTSLAAERQTTPDRGVSTSFVMSEGRICDPIRHMGC
jgi:hypothetical protein